MFCLRIDVAVRECKQEGTKKALKQMLISAATTHSSLALQAIKVGTYDEVFGPGSTPLWALPTDVMKYQDTQLIEREAGFVLDYKVSDCSTSTLCTSPEFVHPLLYILPAEIYFSLIFE